MKLTDEQQKFFDENILKQKQVHATQVPVHSEIWSGNASWKRQHKAEIISYVPEDGTWERGKVTWQPVGSDKIYVTGLKTFKTMYASPLEWELSETLMKTMEKWQETSD